MVTFPRTAAVALVLVTQPSGTDAQSPPTDSVGGLCYVDTYGWGGSHLTLSSPC